LENYEQKKSVTQNKGHSNLDISTAHLPCFKRSKISSSKRKNHGWNCRSFPLYSVLRSSLI